MKHSRKTTSKSSNAGGLQSVTQFYDKRVNNQADLNTRLAQAASRPPHHHTGIIREDDAVPEDKVEARVWLYTSETKLCDFLWQVIVGLNRRVPHDLLDLGCGEGGTALRFSELCSEIEITGISLSEQQISMAQNIYPRGRFIFGDMLTTDVPKLFDVVYSIEATEYLGLNGLEVFMRRAYAWLKPSGMLAVVAGSFTSKRLDVDSLSSNLSEVKAFNSHYQTSLSASDDYRRLANEAGFSLAADINLGPVTIPYWRSRRDHPDLRNSKDGDIEALILRGLEDGLAEFHLWAWYKG
jgi:SAM-dependent methyltransferase